MKRMAPVKIMNSLKMGFSGLMSSKRTMGIPTSALLAIIVVAGCFHAANATASPATSGNGGAGTSPATSGNEGSTDSASSQEISSLLMCAMITVTLANFIM